MKTTVATDLHQKISIEDKEIILNGTPESLLGHIQINNDEDTSLFIRDLPLAKSDKSKKGIFKQQNIPVRMAIGAGEKRMHTIMYELPFDTPPGEYEQSIEIGKTKKKLKIIVQPKVDIDINPLELQFVGVETGKTYSAQLTIVNKGNVPFKIPNIKHISMLDEDYLCRAMGSAMRAKGGEGFNPMMDEMVKSIYKDMADWVTVKLDESGKTLKTAASMQLHVHFTLPEKGVDKTKDYFGNLRLWNKLLTYSIKSA
jgi:hypothetical protein